MAKPVAGEWVDEEFSGLARAGLEQVISLMEAREAQAVGLGDEQALCAKHGLRFVSYPIVDRGLPTDVVGFAGFVRQLYAEIAGGLSSVVHCRAGIGRTGLVAAAVLLHTGVSVDQALRHISSCRGVQVPDTDEQRDWLHEHARRIVALGES